MASYSRRRRTAAASAEREFLTDAFDYQDTVNALTIQFLSEHEQTRAAALKWLIIMHHQKASKKVRHFPSLRSYLCN
jgi:vacuole morphology and inheritance protein 14